MPENVSLFLHLSIKSALFSCSLSDQLSTGNDNVIPVIQEVPSVKIDVLSSKDRVTVKTNDKTVSLNQHNFKYRHVVMYIVL